MIPIAEMVPPADATPKSAPAAREPSKTGLLFDYKDHAVYEQARDDLRYLPVGLISRIAREVGCERQYVHQVIYSPLPFSEKSAKAYLIWTMLRAAMDPETNEELKVCKDIIGTLERGEAVTVTMASRKARFFERKFVKLGIKVTILRKPTVPITYTYIPEGAPLPEEEPAAP